MTWFALYVLIFAIFLAPAAGLPADDGFDTLIRVFYFVLIGGPATVFAYYCLIRGFQEFGVFG